MILEVKLNMMLILMKLLKVCKIPNFFILGEISCYIYTVEMGVGVSSHQNCIYGIMVVLLVI